MRRLRARGVWLDADELLSFTDRYPDDAAEMAALYAQGTSFVWHLVAGGQPADRGAIEALLGLPVVQSSTVASGGDCCEYIVRRPTPATVT